MVGGDLPAPTSPLDHIESRIAEAENLLKPTAERLIKAVETSLSSGTSVTARSRVSTADVLKQTVPDPVDPGLR
jgi:type IV secretion system protein VirD4